MKKLIVFGGTGFIGYHICKEAIKKKYQVFSISKKKPTKDRKINKVNYIFFDASNLKNFNNISKDFQIIINSSGYGSHFQGKRGKKIYNEHVSILKNILEHFKYTRIEKLIHLGSSLEYSKAISKIQENHKANPDTYYGRAKLTNTKLLQKIYKIKKIPITVFRLFQVFGPKQSDNRIIAYVISKLKKNKNVFLSSGRQLRDFCYISDIVKAIFASIEIKKSNGQIINLGSGKAIRVKELVEKIYIMIKKGELHFNKKKTHPGENMMVLPNIEKAKKILNWEPKVSLDKGIRKTINAIK